MDGEQKITLDDIWNDNPVVISKFICDEIYLVDGVWYGYIIGGEHFVIDSTSQESQTTDDYFTFLETCSLLQTPFLFMMIEYDSVEDCYVIDMEDIIISVTIKNGRLESVTYDAILGDSLTTIKYTVSNYGTTQPFEVPFEVE